MSQKFKTGDSVVFKNMNEQIENEQDNPTPYTIDTSEMKDLYNSGLPEDCWDEIVSIKDANGEVFVDFVEATDISLAQVVID
jgi:hypothetical protein